MADQNRKVETTTFAIHNSHTNHNNRAIWSTLPDPFGDITSNMPFSSARHCSRDVQQRVGLDIPSCNAPRRGNRNATGLQGTNILSCCAHQVALSTEEARSIWGLMDANRRDNPTNANDAMAIANIAHTAGEDVPAVVMGLLPPDHALRKGVPIEYVISIGGYLSSNKDKVAKFISFLNRNMDRATWVRWELMTGQEQGEWYRAWRYCRYAYTRHEPETRGLRGTDPSRMSTLTDVIEGLARSPSLARRVPDDHPVPQADWTNEIRRQLFG